MGKLNNPLLVNGMFFGLMSLLSLSCKKNDVSSIQPAPVITWISPGSAYTGDTVTISGQNFNGTDHVDFGTTPSNFTVVNSTTIKTVMTLFDAGFADITVETIAGKAIKKGFKSLGPAPGLIDGYKNSDEVGKESLVAYWGFNSDTLGSESAFNALEYYSKLPPLKLVNAGRYENGVKGNSVSLNNGYLIYPPLPNLNGTDLLTSYTVSQWVILDYTSAYVPLFLLTGAQYPDLEGQIQLSILNEMSQSLVTPDTMFVNWVQAINTASGIISDRWNAIPKNPYSYYASGINWTHLAITYDGVSHVLYCYINGTTVGSKTSAAVVDPAKFRLETPAQVLFGTFAFTEDGFSNSLRLSDYPNAAHGITGLIDEVRVFKAALSQPQITALFDLGQVGR